MICGCPGCGWFSCFSTKACTTYSVINCETKQKHCIKTSHKDGSTRVRNLWIMARKHCIVKTCYNTTVTNPEKLFLTVPQNKQRREAWFNATNFSDKHRYSSNRLYCCEDHFSLPDDATNWMYFKMCGAKITLRADVVPHRNLNIGKENAPVTQEAQLSNSAKKRKAEWRAQIERPSTIAQQLFKDITNSPIPTTDKVITEPLIQLAQTGSDNTISVRRITPPAASMEMKRKAKWKAQLERSPKVARKSLLSDCSTTRLDMALGEPFAPLTQTTSDNSNSVRRRRVKQPAALSVVTTAGPYYVPSVERQLATSTSGHVMIARGIQTNLKKQFRSVKTNTSSVKYTARATSPCFQEYDEHETYNTQRMGRRSPLQPTLSGSPSHSVSTVVESLFSSLTPSTEGSSEVSFYKNVTCNTDNRIHSTMILMETKSRFYLGVPEEVYVFVTQVTLHTAITSRNVFIVLKKIRLGDPYSRLGDDFSMSVANVQRIFTESVPKIADFVQELVFWPLPVQIKRTLPIAFRARYRCVESIIDCLEIEIEKPSNALRQALTWSDYKKCNTLKFLISSTPAGFVNFISGAYGGRVTDKEILKLSGYLDVLPNGASVMADRGFKHVTPMLTEKDCKLIRPPSVSEGEKLSRMQVKQNRNIASLRVHIERVIRRLREFELLGPHSCLHHDLQYLANHMLIIACGIINVQGPLIKK